MLFYFTEAPLWLKKTKLMKSYQSASSASLKGGVAAPCPGSVCGGEEREREELCL